MPDFGVNPLKFLEGGFGTRSLPQWKAPFGMGGPAMGVEGESEQEGDCYEIFVADIKIERTSETSNVPTAPPYNNLGPKYQGGSPSYKGWKVSSDPNKASKIIAEKGGSEKLAVPIYNLKGDILKICYCLPGWVWTPISAYLKWEGFPNVGGSAFSGIIDPDKRTGGYKAPGRYRVVLATRVCDSEEKGETCRGIKCPCKDQKGISLTGITHKTTEYKASNGTTIKLKTPGMYEKVIKQIVEEEKKIKLKCRKEPPDDHTTSGTTGTPE